MSRTISFRDLMVCEELAHIKNEIELLHPSNDDLVASVLSKIGFDIDYPVAYIPSKHRDMQNKVAVGFMAVGDISLNRDFINSPMCSVVDRMVAAAYTDPSLTKELANLTGNQVNFKALMDDEGDYAGDELDDSLLEPDYEYVSQQIKQLESIRDAIRGPMYNEAGALKTYAEYKQYYQGKASVRGHS